MRGSLKACLLQSLYCFFHHHNILTSCTFAFASILTKQFLPIYPPILTLLSQLTNLDYLILTYWPHSIYLDLSISICLLTLLCAIFQLACVSTCVPHTYTFSAHILSWSSNSFFNPSNSVSLTSYLPQHFDSFFTLINPVHSVSVTFIDYHIALHASMRQEKCTNFWSKSA